MQLAFEIGQEFQLKKDTPIQDVAGYRSLGDFISMILPNIYIIASLILFILLVVGGFAIMTSGDDPQKKGQGSKAITSAIIGFIIIFTSYWLIKLIEFLTGINIFKSGV